MRARYSRAKTWIQLGDVKAAAFTGYSTAQHSTSWLHINCTAIQEYFCFNFWE